MSSKCSSILKLLTWQNAPVAFFAVLCVTWHGHAIRIMISGFFAGFNNDWLIFSNIHWCISTRRDKHFSQGTLLTSKTLPIDENIAAAVEALLKYISKNLLTTLCWLLSNILTVTGFIFSRFWWLLPSVHVLKHGSFISFINQILFHLVWLPDSECMKSSSLHKNSI